MGQAERHDSDASELIDNGFYSLAHQWLWAGQPPWDVWEGLSSQERAAMAQAGADVHAERCMVFWRAAAPTAEEDDAHADRAMGEAMTRAAARLREQSAGRAMGNG